MAVITSSVSPESAVDDAPAGADDGGPGDVDGDEVGGAGVAGVEAEADGPEGAALAGADADADEPDDAGVDDAELDGAGTDGDGVVFVAPWARAIVPAGTRRNR
jgi:hypothetical protein